MSVVRPDKVKDRAERDVACGAVRGNDLLDRLPPSEFDRLAPYFVQTRRERGFVLQEAGCPIERVWFPHAGLVSLVIRLSDDRALDTVPIGREGAVGISAALGVTIARSTAVVQFPLIATQIAAARLAEVAAQSKPVREAIARYNDLLFAHAQQMLACNSVHPIRERLSRWLLNARDRVGSDFLDVTQEALAEALGVQRTTITMICGLLQSEGTLRVRRGRIYIHDAAALERSACACYRIGRQLSSASD